MDLLLDINMVVDHCLNRQPYVKEVNLAMATCLKQGGRLWVYAGSVQTLEYVTYKELLRKYKNQGRPSSSKQVQQKARKRLHEFVSDKHWLAALANEGDVFSAVDPEDEQLIRALDRFEPGSIKLLTRDQYLLTEHSDKTISPEQYCQLKTEGCQLNFIDLKTQQDHIRSQLEKNIHHVLHHGQYIMGPEVKELEEKLQGYTQAKHCITVASGTEALLISLMALDIGPGDEVITTPFTFVATAEVIVNVGATPVFVDIQSDTCNIDPEKIEQAITPNTKAIMPVSLYGQPADMDEINAVASKYGNIPVIEDAAQSFGATYKGKKSCNLSTIGCTSFFPSKPLGCYGDGGAIFTSDDNIAQACREIRVHGQSKRYVHTRVGVGGRMDTIQAAVVLAKLKQFDQEVQQRQEIGARYTQLIYENCKLVTPPHLNENRTSVYGQYTIKTKNRSALRNNLKVASIPSAVHYPLPLNKQPAYQTYTKYDTPIAQEIAEQVMSLPMHPELNEENQVVIIKQLCS